MAKISAKEHMQGFKDFLTKQNVVGLAVGVIVGGAAAKLVASLVENIINPLIGLVTPSGKLFSAVTIGPIKIGAFLNSALDFTILMFVVYFVINKTVSMIMGEEKK